MTKICLRTLCFIQYLNFTIWCLFIQARVPCEGCNGPIAIHLCIDTCVILITSVLWQHTGLVSATSVAPWQCVFWLCFAELYFVSELHLSCAGYPYPELVLLSMLWF